MPMVQRVGKYKLKVDWSDSDREIWDNHLFGHVVNGSKVNFPGYIESNAENFPEKSRLKTVRINETKLYFDFSDLKDADTFNFGSYSTDLDPIIQDLMHDICMQITDLVSLMLNEKEKLKKVHKLEVE